MFHARMLENENEMSDKLESDPEFFNYIHSFLDGDISGDEPSVRHGASWSKFVKMLKNNDRVVSALTTGNKNKVKFAKFKHIKKYVKGT